MNNDELKKILLNQTPLIDVRAPIEYQQGHLPGAINLPILSDIERASIGTAYKKEGSEAATALGYKLVSGAVKDSRVQAWQDFIVKNPETVIYCFRGGLRSQITQKWLQELGVSRPLIQGGYKKVRQFLIDETSRLTNLNQLIILSGSTGSGKTHFLNEVKSFFSTIDLELHAQHRGSAFGAWPIEQPSQINFENQIALALMQVENFHSSAKSILVEDESHMIGKCAVPKVFFDKMRISPVVWIEESLEVRIKNIFEDYIANTVIGRFEKPQALLLFQNYKNSTQKISKKLGGLRAQEILNLLNQSESDFLNSESLDSNLLWIEKLLVYYYDPLYLDSLQRRQVAVLFKGSRKDCFNYLKS